MKTLTIRKATSSDLYQLQNLTHELYLHDKVYYPYFNVNFPFEKRGIDYLKERITQPNGVCLVAELDNKLVGFLTGNQPILLSWAPVRKTSIENLYIKKNARRKYIGTKLIEEFLKWSHSHGITYHTVSTLAGNINSRKFYKKLGFNELVITLEKSNT